MSDTTKRDTAAREERDRDVERAQASAGRELRHAAAKVDRAADRKATRTRDAAVAKAQRDEARNPIVSRHTFRPSDDADELEGKAAAQAQQAAVVAAMDAENDRRADELGLPTPAHYADGVP